jgi:hypothetical protein
MHSGTACNGYNNTVQNCYRRTILTRLTAILAEKNGENMLAIAIVGVAIILANLLSPLFHGTGDTFVPTVISYFPLIVKI